MSAASQMEGGDNADRGEKKRKDEREQEWEEEGKKGEIHYVKREEGGASERGNRHLYRRASERGRERELAWDLN